MLVIGGGVPNLDNNVESVDDFPQGVGVFDLTEIQWKRSSVRTFVSRYRYRYRERSGIGIYRYISYTSTLP